jgi:hypothetical protein
MDLQMSNIINTIKERIVVVPVRGLPMQFTVFDDDMEIDLRAIANDVPPRNKFAIEQALIDTEESMAIRKPYATESLKVAMFDPKHGSNDYIHNWCIDNLMAVFSDLDEGLDLFSVNLADYLPDDVESIPAEVYLLAQKAKRSGCQYFRFK